MNRPLLLLFSFLFLGVSGRILYAGESQLLDQVIAVVNDEAITQSELDGLLRPIYEEYKQRYSGEKFVQELTEARRKLLNQLIEDRIVFQEAKSRSIKSDAAQIDEQMSEFQKRFATPGDMEAALNSQGVTLHGLRDRLERQAMVRTLHEQEVRAKVLVSPSEIEKYYDEHPADFLQKARARPRSITLKKNDEAREKGLKDEEAWKKIQDIHTKLKKGADFAEVARQESQDAQAKNGGLGDWVERGAMIEAVDQVLFKLKPGESSEIVETAMGYHLFRLEEIQAENKKSLEEVRDEIHGKLYQQKSEQRFNEWMQELKQKTYISIR